MSTYFRYKISTLPETSIVLEDVVAVEVITKHLGQQETL